MTDDLRTLVRRCLKGEQQAMNELVDRYRGRVLGLCLRMLGHRQDAEDAVQETFVRVLRHLRSWDETRALEPWVLAIAGNRCRSALSTRVRRPSWNALPVALADESAGQLDAARRLQEELDLALVDLRAEHREAFLLFHQQQLGYHEIAERLDRPVGTVKTWVHRARRQIVDFLRDREVLAS